MRSVRSLRECQRHEPRDQDQLPAPRDVVHLQVQHTAAVNLMLSAATPPTASVFEPLTDGKHLVRRRVSEPRVQACSLKCLTTPHGCGRPTHPAGRLHAVTDQRVPVHATDDHGHDGTVRIARLDRQHSPDDFAGFAPFRGYAAEHMLTLDIGPAGQRAVLLLTDGPITRSPATTSPRIRRAFSLMPPSLQVRDAAGGGERRSLTSGSLVGRPQTIAVDLTGHLRPGNTSCGSSTTCESTGDQIVVARGVPTDRLPMVRLNRRRDTPCARVFSRGEAPDGRAARYDYTSRYAGLHVERDARPRYTREGRRPASCCFAPTTLFVIGKPGDEIAVAFDAGARSSTARWLDADVLAAGGRLQ